MVQNQVGSSSSKKIRSAIDFLLTSQSTQVISENIQLTTCSPDIEVVMNKQGGICTKCNTMFKSRTSLIGHLEKCGIKLSSVIPDYDSSHENVSKIITLSIKPANLVNNSINKPKLIIMNN